MAPKQLRGEETDRRVHIWSSGVALGEMVTGRPPFEGETEETLSWPVRLFLPLEDLGWLGVLITGNPINFTGITT
jgi:serine/threonine protein kinase